MEITLDTTDFERSAISGTATVSFLIENRGAGNAYLEGCPDPVHTLVESMDAAWIEQVELNDCQAAQDPVRQTLGGLKAYREGCDEPI